MTQSRGSKLVWVWLVFIIILTASFMMAYAQDTRDTFTTVPKGSWVYDAMNLLYQAGLVSDYPNEWVLSGYELSRFEVAYYLKQFISNQGQSDQNKDYSTEMVTILQKLISEFHSELADLGIQITDIYKISPNLVNSDTNTDGYTDLDAILNKGNSDQTVSYYYLGQYFNEMRWKSFAFIPVINVKPAQLLLLEGHANTINLIYLPRLGKSQSLLVIKGNLPLDNAQSILGYYLFPIENHPELVVNDKNLTIGLNDSVLALLDEVNQVQQLKNLWRFDGAIPLEGYLKLENDLPHQDLIGNINQGLKIGGYLIYTENPSNRNDLQIKDLGLPLYNQQSNNTIVDLDNKNINLLEQNMQS